MNGNGEIEIKKDNDAFSTYEKNKKRHVKEKQKQRIRSLKLRYY